MRITVLAENNAARHFDGEWGLSLLIEVNNKKILFDTGASDLFIRNAALLQINLLELDYIVLSHGHWDHSWGLEPLLKKYLTAEVPMVKRPSFVAHPLTLSPKFRNNGSEFGSLISESTITRNFKSNLTKDSIWLSSNLLFLGEIEKKIEKPNSHGKTKVSGLFIDDYLSDDTALVYKSSKGLLIITGCSHSGICNIIEQARNVCQEERVIDIVGGFHLLNPGFEQLQDTVNYIGDIKPIQLHPCHCTDLESKIALAKVADVAEVYSGLQLDYD